MAFFKNYNFEFNAQRVDVFRSVVVCSSQIEMDDFKEGIAINIPASSFYGVIAESKNSGERLTLDVVAESWGRELRNTAVTEYIEFRQTDAIRLIQDHLIPASWTFEYPPEFDSRPRYLSYILRNGSFLSHIGTILDAIGLDFTIYSTMAGSTLTKTVKAFYRDNFDGRDVLAVEEWKNVAQLSITSDYGKIATSIVITGAESEQGVNQTFMDAEISNWHEAPRLLEVKDTAMSKPELATDSKYFWYFPASESDPTIELLSPGDVVTIDNDKLMIDSVYSLAPIWVASLELGTLTEANLHPYLGPVSAYVASGVLVASIDQSVDYYLESAKRNYTFTNGANLSNYWVDRQLHAIFDDVYISGIKVSSSPYITFNKNLPSTNGFIWMGSERAFYATAIDHTSYYELTGMTRAIPTCATASCQHAGTANEPNNHVCRLLNQSGYLYNFCDLLKSVKAKYPSVTDVSDFRWCPLCFDNDSTCPAMRCPHVKNDIDFATVCPKGLTKAEITWTEKYQHNKGSIVFPASYYYATAPDGSAIDTYEIYARDSMIAKYGYLVTRVSAKGIADIDGLDKMAEGRLRLSAIPINGTFTYLEYDPWVVPASAFPGDVVQVTVASMGRFDHQSQTWYPTQWFDVSSSDHTGDPEWTCVSSPSEDPQKWLQTTKKFCIQKTTKDQRGMPKVSFGAGDIGFANLTDYITDTMDVTSQRHRNQDMTKIIGSSENGLAAQVQNIRTGAIEWVRMIR